jgi:ferritin-like metal-binding protein YciE
MATMSKSSLQEQLVEYLADAHSIEEQALVQMRRAPALAGDDRLAAAFDEHLVETERHERLVRERLEAQGADPSRLKDLAGKAGGWGMLLFAKTQPDTPGKLAAHAYSYEHMELAAYELLCRAAVLAGDEKTASIATGIAIEESRMGERLEDLFDAAVEASLQDLAAADLDEQLNRYLADAHALEQQAVQLLGAGTKLVDDETLASFFEKHLAETHRHARLVSERLEARDGDTSKLKDFALRAGGLNIAAFFGAQPDTTPKLSGFAYAFEHLEVAAYELLKRVATRAGDTKTVSMAEAILAEERAAAEDVASTWDRTMGSA